MTPILCNILVLTQGCYHKKRLGPIIIPPDAWLWLPTDTDLEPDCMQQEACKTGELHLPLPQVHP